MSDDLFVMNEKTLQRLEQKEAIENLREEVEDLRALVALVRTENEVLLKKQNEQYKELNSAILLLQTMLDVPPPFGSTRYGF